MEDGRRLVTGPDPYLLRTRLDFLMLHAMMLRRESTRKADLADLCSVLLPDESSECLGLVLRTSDGKTIPLAMRGNLRMQHYHAALRHRDPVLCPVRSPSVRELEERFGGPLAVHLRPSPAVLRPEEAREVGRVPRAQLAPSWNIRSTFGDVANIRTILLVLQWLPGRLRHRLQ